MTGLMPSQHGVHNWLDDAKLDEWPDDWSVVAEYRTLPQDIRKPRLSNRNDRQMAYGAAMAGVNWLSALGHLYLRSHLGFLGQYYC